MSKDTNKPTKHVSDRVVYHDNKRYAPGTPLPAAALKDLPKHFTREATKAELKELEESKAAEAELIPTPADNPDAEEKAEAEA